MDGILGGELSDQLRRAETAVYDFLAVVLDAWVLIQLAIVVAGLIAAQLIGGWVERRLESRVRAVQGQRRLLRFLALLLRRTRWIAAALLLSAAAVVVRAATLPSRSVIILTFAGLILAWVVISIASRLIRNRSLGRLVAWIAWIVVALHITGTYDEMAGALDTLAFQAGTVRISVYDIIQATLVVAVALWLASFIGGLFERRIAATSELTPSLKVLVGKLVRIVLLVIAAGVALTALGIDITALTVFSGALGVGIGFGLQKVVSNFVSGVIILLDKSIKPGDTISLGETFGWVRSLRARFVSVMTRDGTEYLVPNEDFITQRVVSWSHTDTLHRLDVEFGVAATSDPHLVRRLAIEAASAVARVEARPHPVCHLTKFDGAEMQFILRFWIADPQNGITNVRGAVLLACWDAFKAAGLELPLPTRNLILRHPVDIRVDPPTGPVQSD